MTLWHTLFGFEGRIGRATLWLSGFAILLIDLSILLFVSSWIHSEYFASGVAHRPDGAVVGAGLGLLLAALLSVWAGLALKVKRCHDLGHSGWRLLIGLIPVFGWAWLLVELGFMPGSRRRNPFGPSPESVEPEPAVVEHQEPAPRAVEPSGEIENLPQAEVVAEAPANDAHPAEPASAELLAAEESPPPAETPIEAQEPPASVPDTALSHLQVERQPESHGEASERPAPAEVP